MTRKVIVENAMYVYLATTEKGRNPVYCSVHEILDNVDTDYETVVRIFNNWRSRFDRFWTHVSPKHQTPQNWERNIERFKRDHKEYYLIPEGRSGKFYQPTYEENEIYDQRGLSKQGKGFMTVSRRMYNRDESLMSGQKIRDVLGDTENHLTKYLRLTGHLE